MSEFLGFKKAVERYWKSVFKKKNKRLKKIEFRKPLENQKGS